MNVLLKNIFISFLEIVTFHDLAKLSLMDYPSCSIFKLSP